MFACSNGIAEVIGAGTRVEMLGDRVDLNGVGLFGSRGYVEGAVDRMISVINYPGEFFHAALAAALNLFLK